VLVAA
jgi:hypothetical protein